MKQTPAYDIVNEELLSLIPAKSRRVVDVGCMVGSLARATRQRFPHVHYTGLDINADYALQAAKHCNEAFQCDIESIGDGLWDKLFPSDCWIFGDCLEHLVDPWRVLTRLSQAIDKDGSLLICIPNAQHWSVQRCLTAGQFYYQDSGLMDRTHLRWFTRITLLDMLKKSGWDVVSAMSRNLPESPDQARMLEAIRTMAVASGVDPDQAVADAIPFQYVLHCKPAAQVQALTQGQSVPAAKSGGVPVHLYQIAYNAETHAAADQNYPILDNRGNERPDWYEYWPMRRFLLNEQLDEQAFYGFFSPKFSSKTFLTLPEVESFVQTHAAKADVMLFSPQADMGSFFLNVFEQGELFDPGLMQAYGTFLQSIGQSPSLKDMVMDSRQIVFSNYFVARPAFWREWLQLNEALFAACEDTSNPLSRELTVPTTYPGDAQRKTFLQERAASYLLTTQPHWRSVAYNPFGMAWSASRFREFPVDAVTSDALKLAYRQQGFALYLSAFAGIRQKFIANSEVKPA